VRPGDSAVFAGPFDPKSRFLSFKD
jgi:hypothetical protein